jgi:hypothetical protein
LAPQFVPYWMKTDWNAAAWVFPKSVVLMTEITFEIYRMLYRFRWRKYVEMIWRFNYPPRVTSRMLRPYQGLIITTNLHHLPLRGQQPWVVEPNGFLRSPTWHPASGEGRQGSQGAVEIVDMDKMELHICNIEWANIKIRQYDDNINIDNWMTIGIWYCQD